MIEELLEWPVRNRNVIRLGRRVEEINREFSQLGSNLASGFDGSVVNMRRARSLSSRIKDLLGKATRLSPSDRFDRLVLTEFRDSLFTQLEYIKFFFTKKYSQEEGVREFFNYAFLPEKSFRGKPEENGAVAYLEGLLRKINYNALTRRENLMRDIELYEVSVNPGELERMVLEQIPRLRRMLAEYNTAMGFETKDQVEAQEVVEQQREAESAQQRLKSFLGPSMVEVADLIIDQQRKRHKGLLSRQIELTDALTSLVYNLVFTYEGYCAYDSATRTMEVDVPQFRFFRDKRTGKIRLYSGDVDRSIGHENVHRLQTHFSRLMPLGLRGSHGEYNITGRTIAEGTAIVLEDNFMGWLNENRRRFGLSGNDIKTATLHPHAYKGKQVIRLCHSIYERELSSAEGKDHYDAHVKLAAVSRTPVLADEDFLEDEALTETFDLAFYVFGEKYVRETLAELERRETKRLGSKRRSRGYLRRNEPLVMQGLLTGNWGWSTHKDFFLGHYWPKARKYCDN